VHRSGLAESKGVTNYATLLDRIGGYWRARHMNEEVGSSRHYGHVAGARERERPYAPVPSIIVRGRELRVYNRTAQDWVSTWEMAPRRGRSGENSHPRNG